MEANMEKKLRFMESGLYAHMSHILNQDAFIVVEASVENQGMDDVDVWVDLHMHQLIDNGKLQMDEEMGVKAAGAIKLSVKAGSWATAKTKLCVEDAVLWNPDNPVCYVIEAVLYKAVAEGEALPNPRLLAGLALEKAHSMKMLDFQETHFGIREVTVDAKNGLCINGTSIKLKGGPFASKYANENFDFESQYKLVTEYKEQGYNAIFVHQPQAAEYLTEICNRLGILVLDFVEDTKQILLERNAPAVVAWITKGMSQKQIKELDATRMSGGCIDASIGMRDGVFDPGLWDDVTEELCAAWEVCGFPAEYTDYRMAHALFPNRIMFAATDDVEAGWEKVLKYSFLIGSLSENI